MSKIQWTDKTWNPVRGCSIVSPGCVNCYAMKQAHRFSGPGRAYEGLTKLTKAGPQWTGKVVCDDAKLLEPLSWRKPCRVFVNSMSDLFHEDVPDAFIDKVFAVMGVSGRHTFQILTKRAERMRAYFDIDEVDLRQRWGDAAGTFLDGEWVWNDGKRFRKAIERFVGCGYGLDESDDPEDGGEMIGAEPTPVPLPNVWLGVSCEDQPRADERIPLLLQTPAAVRFVSAEPLLGPIDLDDPLTGYPEQTSQRHYVTRDMAIDAGDRALEGSLYSEEEWQQTAPPLDWVIVGGESGPGARPCDLAWVRSIVAQCHKAGVACFVKQLGARPDWSMYDDGVLPELMKDRKGGDPSEWPADLRVREWPVETP